VDSCACNKIDRPRSEPISAKNSVPYSFGYTQLPQELRAVAKAAVGYGFSGDGGGGVRIKNLVIK
jgi:hypothetical protein